MGKVTPFLMFEGNAEEAMNHYTSAIADSEIKSVSRYGADDVGKEGQIIQATFSLKGQEVICIDSSTSHDFSFTPAFSLFVTCETEAEIDMLYEKFAQDGKELMPLGDYGFSKKFGWVVDRFSVAWQFTLPFDTPPSD